MVAAVVILTFTAALRGRRRPGEAAETLGRRVGRGADGSEHLVPRRRRRADAGRADAGVAGLLAEAATLAEAGDIAGDLEAKVAATAHHVLDHAAELLTGFAGVLDHHGLAKVAPLGDETHVAAAQQRRLLELILLLTHGRAAGDRYIGVKIVLGVHEAALRGGCASGGVLRARRRRAVQIVLPRQLRRRGG